MYHGCCSVVKLCPTLCDPMDCSTPGSPVLHYVLAWICLNSCPLSQWCYLTISSSVTPWGVTHFFLTTSSYYFVLFLSFKIYLFILFLSGPGLRGCLRTFFSFGKWGLLFLWVCRLLISGASLSWSVGSRWAGFSSCCSRALRCRLSSRGTRA